MAESTLTERPVNGDMSDSQMNAVNDLKEQSRNTKVRTSSPVSCCAESNVPNQQTSGSSVALVSPSLSSSSSSSYSHDERENAATTHPETTTPTSPPSTTTFMVLPEESEALLRQLARQLEFYFSRYNLSKDTYLQTLRDLNDGYVPVTILASFGKVQALVSYDSVNAVLQAATDYSDLLEVVTIDIESRKRVEPSKETDDVVEEEEAATAAVAADNKKKKTETILAVGPVHKEPLDIDVDTTTTPLATATASATATITMVSPFVSPARAVTLTPITPSSQTSTEGGAFQNTIIMRDVPSDVTEDQVRALFDAPTCPPILHMHLDVANCWFVSFDTTSRDDMINIMISLKSKQLPNGESVRARLKAAPAATMVTTTAGAPLLPMMMMTTMPGFDGVAATGYFPNLGFSTDGMICPPSPRSRRPNGKRGRKSNKTAKQSSSNNSTSTSGTVSNINSSSNNGKASTAAAAAGASPKGNRNRGSKQKKATATPEADQHRVASSVASSASVASSSEPSGVIVPPAPPVLADDQFPALGDVVLVNTDEMKAADAEHAENVVLEDTPSKNNSVAGDDEEEDERKFKNMSDAASTATTTSSSSSSIPTAKIVIGAYAAALLKTPPTPAPKPVAPATAVAPKPAETAPSKKMGDQAKNRKMERKDSGNGRMDHEKAKRDTAASRHDLKEEEEVNDVSPPAPVVITPPTWGRGRSFADVLRKPESGELVTSS